jgi:hypothetical protein
MNAAQEYLIKNNLIPIKQWKVQSKTEKGRYYTVEKYNNDKYSCHCCAGSMKKPCRHVREIKHSQLGIIKSNYEQRKSNRPK